MVGGEKQVWRDRVARDGRGCKGRSDTGEHVLSEGSSPLAEESGRARLTLAKPYRRLAAAKRGIVRYLPAACAFVFMVAAWQIAVTLLKVPDYIIPSPIKVVTAMVVQWSAIEPNLVTTLIEVVLGFGLSCVVGIPLGVAFVVFGRVEQALYPLVAAFQGIPKVALAPILILWFGFGSLPRIVLALLIAFFPILINTVSGLRGVNPGYSELALSMRASKRQLYFRILLPGAMPQMFAGFRVAMALALVGAIVGELVGGRGGLGYLITVGDSDLQIPFVFAIFAWLALMSVVLLSAIDVAERILIPWSHQRREQG